MVRVLDVGVVGHQVALDVGDDGVQVHLARVTWHKHLRDLLFLDLFAQLRNLEEGHEGQDVIHVRKVRVCGHRTLFVLLETLQNKYIYTCIRYSQ